MRDKETQASWDTRTIGVFIAEMVNQIYKKERTGLAFTKKGWDSIIAGFNEKTGNSYTKKQFKNKYDALRKEWKAWDDLFSKETGITFDWSKNMVIADDEWWDRKIMENKAYDKYRHSGLMYGNELRMIFKDVLASGADMLAPSASQQRPSASHQRPSASPQRLVDLDANDVYIPTMPREEGSGDSDEEIQGDIPFNVGVTDDLRGFTLGTTNPPTAATGVQSTGKRTRGEASSKSRKKKGSASQQIADAVSSIASKSQNRLDAFSKIYNDDSQIQEIVKELIKMPELREQPDMPDLCFRSCNMMMYPLPRSMYLGLREDREELLKWLKHHAYNSPQYQKAPGSS